MSKIYEALLRAEIDRLEVNPTNTSVSTPFWRPGAAVPASPRAATLPADLSLSVAQSPLEHSSSPLVEEMQDVVLRHWDLDLSRLPSVEERGGEVEQFRSLRSRMFQFRALNKLQSILVSSGLPEEGKSFIATNLAISFARHKANRVLLIDGDMRRGTIHKLLGTSNEPGLTEYLSGKASTAQVLQRAQVPKDGRPLPPGIASLDFIGCGASAEHAADLSGNNRFATLMTDVSPIYDWIVVDSSPVNLVADGVNLASSCDGVLLVARGGITKYTTAQRALAELKASKVIGVILNAVVNPPTTGGYYGYESYDKQEA